VRLPGAHERKQMFGDWPFSMETRCSGRLGAVFSKLSGITDDLKPKLEGDAPPAGSSCRRLADYRLLREYPFCALIIPMGAITGPEPCARSSPERPHGFDHTINNRI